MDASDPSKVKIEALNLDEVESDENNLSDNDEYLPEIECSICGITFSSLKTFEQHLKGKKHYKMISQEKIMSKVSKLKGLNPKPSKTEENSGDESDDSKEMYCEVCDKSISGYIPYFAHLKGGVHGKNLKKKKLKDEMKDMPNVMDNEGGENKDEEDDIIQKPFARCTTCQKVFSGPENFRQHLKSGNHKKKLQQMVLVENLKSKQPTDLKNGDNEDEMTYSCDVCDKSFSGPVPYHIHLQSAVHNKELKRIEVAKEIREFCLNDTSESNYTCKECKKPFTDPFAFKRHLERNDHDKQAAKSQILSFVTSHPEISLITPDENLSSDEETQSSEHEDSYFLICKLCHVSFSGPENAQKHINSKKHLTAKKERRRMKLLMKEKTGKENTSSPNLKSFVPENRNDDGQDNRGKLSDDGKISLAKGANPNSNEDFELI